MAHMSDTDGTKIARDGEQFVVTGWGGYDGYLKRRFDQVEDALDFVAALWHLDSSTVSYRQENQKSGTHPHTMEKLIKESQCSE